MYWSDLRVGVGTLRSAGGAEVSVVELVLELLLSQKPNT